MEAVLPPRGVSQPTGDLHCACFGDLGVKIMFLFLVVVFCCCLILLLLLRCEYYLKYFDKIFRFETQI